MVIKKDIKIYATCVLCNSVNIKYKDTFKDEFLSKENFELWQCGDCGFEFTQGIPSIANMDKYYESKEYVSHSNTQKGIIYKLYNIVRSQMLNTKKNWIKKYASKDSKTLLDIGCGTGHFIKIMQLSNFHVVGVEPNKIAITVARSFIKTQWVYSTLEEVNNLHTTFDVITLFHVLEHLHDLQNSFQQINHLLKEDGLLTIAVPNRNSFDATHYKMAWAAYDMPRHLWHFSYENIKQLASQYGMKIVAYKPMVFDAFYVSLLSEKQYCKSKFYFLKGVWWGGCSVVGSFFNRKKSSSIVYFIKRKK
ncbi:MAG: class I SAM-dependent methyltransferase [Chitinophagaceae bacterium]